MAQPRENPAQIAPGEEASQEVIMDGQMTGWMPTPHMGYPLYQSLYEGIESGRY